MIRGFFLGLLPSPFVSVPARATPPFEFRWFLTQFSCFSQTTPLCVSEACPDSHLFQSSFFPARTGGTVSSPPFSGFEFYLFLGYLLVARDIVKLICCGRRTFFLEFFSQGCVFRIEFLSSPREIGAPNCVIPPSP